MQKIIEKGEPLLIENKTFNNLLDFTAFLPAILVSEGNFEVQVKGGVTFKNCYFKQPVITYKKTKKGIIKTNFHANLSFLNCQFDDEVTFKGATIYGKADFSRSVFAKKAVFEETSFYQKAYFFRCRYDDELRFQNAVFYQLANFLHAEFYKLSSFQSTQFRDDVQMGNTKFYAYADFSLTEFQGNALFNYVQFYDKAIFSNSYVNKRFEMTNSEHENTQIFGYKFMGKTKWGNQLKKVHFKNNFYLLSSSNPQN